MAQLTLKELANRLGKSTLDTLQLVKTKNIPYERRAGDIFIEQDNLFQVNPPTTTITQAPIIKEQITKPAQEIIEPEKPTIETVIEKEQPRQPVDDIPELLPLEKTEVVVPEIKRKKITEQKRTDRIKVWIDYEIKDKVERRLSKRYSRDKNYIAISIASDLVASCQREELEGLLNSLLPNISDTDNKWIKDAAIKYSKIRLQERESLKALLKRNRRLINAAYELRHDVDRFSLTMFLEHERRPLINQLQDYYRSFTEAIIVYQKLSPDLKEEIFRLQNSSSTDYEFVLALGQETFDAMRGIANRTSSDRSLVNTVAFVLKDENENLDLIEKTRSLEWAQVSLEEMIEYKVHRKDEFDTFVQDVIKKVNIATTDEFDTAAFIKEVISSEFFDNWKKKYGSRSLPFGLFIKYMTAALYLADKKEDARTLAKSIDNESADQLNYLIVPNGKTCLYDLLAKRNLHDATSELIRHWDSYRERLVSEGCVRVRSKRNPPEHAVLTFLKDIVDQIEYKEPQDLEKVVKQEIKEPEKPDFIGLYDYPNKRAWRQKWLEFISSYIERNHLNSKDLKVLCLPGPEALEIKEVYDRLGIPRQNIVGVEIDKERFDYLQTQAQGARLFNEDILSYLRKTNERFDIVMLDMDGFLDKHMFQALQKLFSRGSVNKKAVFGTNFFTTREGEEQKEFYSKPLEAELVELLDEDEIKQWQDPEKLKQALCQYNGVNIDSLKKLRDYGITGMIVKTLLGRQLTEVNPAYSLLPEQERCNKAEAMLGSNGLLKTLIYNDHMRSHLQSFLRQVGLGELTPVIELYFSKAYFIEQAQRYKYETTSAGHVMFYSDFFELNQHDEVFRPFDPLMKRLVQKRKDIQQLYGQGTPKRAKRIKRLMDGVEEFRTNIDPLYHRFTVTNGWLPERLEVKGT